MTKITFSDRYPEIKPTGKEIDTRDTYTLKQDVTAIIDIQSVIIPSGFIFDGASVPWGLWNVFPPVDSDYLVAALLHDFLYQTEYFQRAKCDRIFYEALRALNIGRVKAGLMYLAVRIGGQKCWNERTKYQVMAVRKLAGISGEKRPLFL